MIRPTRAQVFAFMMLALLLWSAVLLCAAVLLSTSGCGGASDAGDNSRRRDDASALHEQRAAHGEGWCCAPTIEQVTPEACGLSGAEADSIQHETLSTECFCWHVVRGSNVHTAGECINE